LATSQCDEAVYVRTVAVASAATGSFGLRLNFALSASDRYSATGHVEIVDAATAPEPATFLLIGSAFVAALRRHLTSARRAGHTKSHEAEWSSKP
jgi:hypothetical protein